MDVEAQLQLIEVILLITFFGIGFFCSLSETALFTLKGPILRKMQKSYPKKAVKYSVNGDLDGIILDLSSNEGY